MAIKHPLILPRQSHVTDLLIRHYHNDCNHGGRGMTLNNLRQHGYWIIGGSAAVASLINKCVFCRCSRGVLMTQKMADLPQDRLNEAPPFSYSGVDVFGPFLIKERRSFLKRYGLLFTCLSSRAIHLKSINSLETSSFINGLRRLLAHREPIRQLHSDCGSNFVGASNELRKEVEQLNSNAVNNFLIQQDCDWFPFKFNAPSASPTGGSWERQIRTVRNALQPLLLQAGTQLDDESFRTFLTEVENIVNSRPLSLDNLSDPEYPEPITTNYLLTLKSKVLLPPPRRLSKADQYSCRRWRRVQHLVNEFWFRWRK